MSQEKSSLKLFYKIKRVNVSGVSKKSIVLQNKNGPCPLIAILNVLLLRGTKLAGFDDKAKTISNDNVVVILGNYMFDRHQQKTQNPEFEKKSLSVIEMLPKMKNGLDVNVKFDDASSFEPTPELQIFDLFNLILVHGWVVDPIHEELYNVIRDKHYNQLIEKYILMEEVLSFQKKTSKEDENVIDNKKQPNPMSDIEKLTTEEKEKIINEGTLINNFLSTSATQLTTFGLEKVRQRLNNKNLAIFFRNNHFSTICKMNEKIYVLCTDEGFLEEPDVVWERLDDIDGDSTYCRGNFSPMNPGDVEREKHDFHNQMQKEVNNQEKLDFELAKKLQQQEDRRAEISERSTPPTKAQSSSKSREQSNSGEKEEDDGDMKYTTEEIRSIKKKHTKNKPKYYNSEKERLKAANDELKELEQARRQRNTQYSESNGQPKTKKKNFRKFRSSEEPTCLIS